MATATTDTTAAGLPAEDERTREEILRRAAGEARPLLLAGGAVISMDPRLGDWERADVLIGGDVIVGVGPGLLSAAGDDGMLVVDCAGTVVLPARVDFTAPGAGSSLTPGVRADVAVVRLQEPAGTPDGPVEHRAGHLDTLLSAGRVLRFRGLPLGAEAERPGDGGQPMTAGRNGIHPHVGTWVDETGFLEQELTVDGRYDETRGGRPHAFQGRYWVDGDRIDYLDDLGFWAFGEVRDGVLHHAGYRMTRR
ncbi:Atu4866 domain-containing protein [Modestobacter sp. SYSU DS0657]